MARFSKLLRNKPVRNPLRHSHRAASILLHALLAFTHLSAGATTLSESVQTQRTCRKPVTKSLPVAKYSEVFPKVIWVTPRGNAEAEQLFEPINNLARPLAMLAANCRQGRGPACIKYRDELEALIHDDALKFDRVRHRQSAISFATGTLGGNLIIRSIALNFREMQYLPELTGFDKDLLLSWLERRRVEFQNIPEKLDSDNLQNHVLHSVLTDIVIDRLRTEGKGEGGSASKRAREVFRLYIENTRPDGSMPNQTRRGNSALKYTNSALAALTMIGYFLAEVEPGAAEYVAPNGVNLPRMAEYYLSAVADESRILGYAAENYAPTDRTSGSRLARSYMAEHHGWIGLFARIWPNTPTSAALQQLHARTVSDADQYYDEILGFGVLCQ